MKKKFRISFNSPVVLSFVALCFVTTLLNYATHGLSNQVLFMTYHSTLTSPMTYVRFFTHIFGHGGWEHLIGNMCYLLLLGQMLEEKYGSKVLTEVIILTALVTGVVNYIVFWNTGLCGASGVVFAFILLSSFTSFKEGEIPLTFILVAVFFLGQQVYEGVAVSDNISQMAHVVGGMVGAISGYEINKIPKSKGESL